MHKHLLTDKPLVFDRYCISVYMRKYQYFMSLVPGNEKDEAEIERLSATYLWLDNYAIPIDDPKI